ncbi:MAG TPA: rhodanese-like domain-containing protein [Thermoanaerobaculia bacterium]|nr:rhodanese-like domain-containing protein [Thermoanaerobaculia bacterium]
MTRTTASAPTLFGPTLRRGLCLLLALLAGGAALVTLAGCRSSRGKAQEEGGRRPLYRKVSPPVAFEIIRDTPETLILDLRTPEEYLGETGHLRRALNIPLDRLPYRILEISAWRQETVLVYCRASDPCGEEGMAVLVSSGFEDAMLIDGGIDGWIEEGFKTELPAGLAGQGPVPPPPPPLVP